MDRAVGKHPEGAAHYATSLTEEQAIQIILRERAGETTTALEAEFGLHRSAILKLVRGMTWRSAHQRLAREEAA